ncbi:hypothetical protein SODALDRAFT_353064 [Sodiomyces alkalinus F11]|uniref:Uncharacterized protein n=1 Tax=Sodiomyces alkalinus (strain CBS 110278 / VKM F-3762 / F11) TaxID=1314773 RepID=A0A3N2PLE4_SODAK|nr:hypothetical protein SODALDRAFT_353064 [Sodiomyces alkalinus F11]ROT35343.1 hypothetical protein SODALDRAFT_353064 [Sodiomyces alkalinus F11]
MNPMTFFSGNKSTMPWPNPPRLPAQRRLPSNKPHGFATPAASRTHPSSLPLRRDLDEVPLFRRAVKTFIGFEMSLTEPISYGMLAGWIKRVGEILGRMYTTICYSLRYNELDGSPMLSATWHSTTMVLSRSRSTTSDAMRCSIGHANSKRRPIDLTPEQVASVNTDPRIKELAGEVERLPHRSKERQEAVRALRNEKQRLKRALMERIKDAWTDEQAVEDIQRQLQGLGFSQPMDVDSAACAPQRPAQKRLVAALTAPVDDTLEGYYQRRDSLIDAIIATAAWWKAVRHAEPMAQRQRSQSRYLMINHAR